MNAKLWYLTVVIALPAAVGVPAQAQPGTVLWTCDVGSRISSAPALAADGTIYVGTYSGLVAVTNTGTTASNKWTFPAGRIGTPAIALDGTVFCGSQDRHLYALNPDGTQKWSFTFRQIPPTDAAIGRDGTVYIQGDGILYALSAAGIQKWAFTNYSTEIGSASPVIGPDETIYAVNGGGSTIHALRPNGSVKWSFSPGGGTTANEVPTGKDGILHFGCVFLFAISPLGNEVWSTQPTIIGFSPVIDKNGEIYVGTHGPLFALQSPGVVVWQALDGLGQSPPATVPALDGAGTVYYCVSNSICAVSPQGQLKWSVFGGYTMPGVYLSETSPIVADDGTLYAALGSTLYAIATGTNGPADSPWPMYRGNARHTGKIEKPALKQPKKRADANFEFQLYAQLGQTNVIETTTNLNTWTSLTSIVVTTVPQPVVDLTASNHPSRFYRTVSP